MSVSLTKLDVNTQKDQVIARLILQRVTYAIKAGEDFLTCCSINEAQFAYDKVVDENDAKTYPAAWRTVVYLVNAAKS